MASGAASLLDLHSHGATEEAVVLLVDGNGITLKRLCYPGSAGEVHLPLREVVMQALESRCAGLVLIHNHPSGSMYPSAADVAVTRSLHNALKPLGIGLLDHIITTDRTSFSFHEQGLL